MGQLYLVSREFLFTLPKTNIAPENGTKPKKESSFPNINFQVRAVSFREGRKMIRISFALSFFLCIVSQEESATDYPKGCYHLDIGNIEGADHVSICYRNM